MKHQNTHKIMKKLVVTILVTSFLFSCGEKEQKNTEDMSIEQSTTAEETSLYDPENINYEGVFQGKINNKEVELKIKGETFEITENGKRANGDWTKVDDGTIIGLEPKSGSISVKNYSISDNNTWVALSDSLTLLEPEQFLKRTSDK